MLSARKRKGIGFFITAGLFVGGGVLMFATETAPDWVSTVIAVGGMIFNALGFTIVFPDFDKPK